MGTENQAWKDAYNPAHLPCNTECKALASVSLIKSCEDIPDRKIGDEVIFTFTIENDGDYPLTDVVVTDSLADSVSGGPVDIPVGETNSEIMAVYTITEMDANAEGFVNTGLVTAVATVGGETVTVTSEATHSVPVLPCENVFRMPLQDVSLNSCPVQTAAEPYNLVTTVKERGNEGFSPWAGDSSDVPQLWAGTLQVPVPASTVGCVLSLQLVWALEDGSSLGQNSLGDLVVSAPTGSGVANPLVVFNDSQIGSAIGGQVVLYDVVANSADTVTLSVPNAASTFYEGKGVVNWQWLETCSDDGTPITVADWDSTSEITDYYGTLNSMGQAVGSSDYTLPTDCDGLTFSWARHVFFNNPIEGMQISDAGWVEYTGVNELTDTTSWIRNTGNPCQLGMASGVVPAGSTFSQNMTSNLDNPIDAWSNQAVMFAGGFNCGEAIEACTNTVESTQQVVFSSECSGEHTKSLTFDVDVTVPDGNILTVEVVVDGVSSTLTYTGNTVEQVVLPISVEMLGATEESLCEVVVNTEHTGDSDGSNISINLTNIEIEVLRNA